MSAEQMSLNIEPLVTPDRVVGSTIADRFDAFHAANPWVLGALEMLTADAVSQGRKRLGIGMLTEVLRWEYGRSTTGDEFRLNNSYRSRYSRLLVDLHPEWAGVFETRELRAA